MTRSSTKRNGRRRSRRRTSGQTTRVLAVVAAVVGAFACDTTADITPVQRLINKVDSPGLRSLTCDPVTSDVSTTLRFSLVDSANVTIEPGAEIKNQTVTVGPTGSFSTDELEFSFSDSLNSPDATVLYPSPDIDCTSAADCPDGFECTLLNPAIAAEDTRRVCGRVAQIQRISDTLGYVSPEFRRQAIVLAVDYGRTLLGFDPSAGAGRVDTRLSTDPTDIRVAGARTMVNLLRDGLYADGSRLCVASFAGQGRSSVQFLPDTERCFLSLEDESPQSCGAICSNVTSLGNGERQIEGRSVWAAINLAINQLTELGSGFERHVVVFTDGRDTGSLMEQGDTFANVLSNATANEVELHLIQLDNPKQKEGETVTPAPRIGPLDELAQLACATGGTYQYAREPEDLRGHFRALGTTLPAFYEVEVEVPTLADSSLTGGGYRLATNMTVQIAQDTRTIRFRGDLTDPSTSTRMDRRLTVFRRPIPEDGGDGSGGDGSGGDGSGGDGSGGDGSGGDGSGGDGSGGDGSGGDGSGGDGSGGDGSGGDGSGGDGSGGDGG